MRFQFILLCLILIMNSAKSEIIYPNENLKPLDVIQIQLKALQNNDSPTNDTGIEQTWVFAHPRNKMVTGPYPRFRIMLYDPHYRILINHSSHNINLLQESENRYVFGVNIVSEEQQNFYYEWQIEKGSEENCQNCWFTSAVSYPQVRGENT